MGKGIRKDLDNLTKQIQENRKNLKTLQLKIENLQGTSVSLKKAAPKDRRSPPKSPRT